MSQTEFFYIADNGKKHSKSAVCEERRTSAKGGIYRKVQVERIHLFQDGNGRAGRLVMFKECLRCGIVPFIITDDMKMFYCRGLANWDSEKGYLTDICLAAQDEFKAALAYFRILCNS